jgi:hypothetical protein
MMSCLVKKNTIKETLHGSVYATIIYLPAGTLIGDACGSAAQTSGTTALTIRSTTKSSEHDCNASITQRLVND